MATQIYKAWCTAWAAVLVIAAPARFVARSVDDALQLQRGTLTVERAQELRKSFTEQFQAATLLIQRSLFVALFVVAGATVPAGSTAAVLQSVGFKKTEAWSDAL